MNTLPGVTLALILAISGQYLSTLVGVTWMGLAKSPISAIMIAILLGIIFRNTVGLPARFQIGVQFSLVRLLRIGIILLGLRLSLDQIGAVGVRSIPVIVGSVVTALFVVTLLSRKIGLSARLGTLIAIGTSVCGATAIIATAPAIGAKDDEVAYSVACITLFGVAAMLVYPFAAHWLFDADSLRSGLFLGTSVHETAQVAGAGLVYQQYYDDPRVLEIATITKLVRNLGMLIIIPAMTILYHRRSADGGIAPGLRATVPLFVVGFAAMSLLRTVGDMSENAFGILPPEMWAALIGNTNKLAELFLGIAMASVGLGTSIKGIVSIGFKPLGAGLFSALVVGAVSAGLIQFLY